MFSVSKHHLFGYSSSQILFSENIDARSCDTESAVTKERYEYDRTKVFSYLKQNKTQYFITYLMIIIDSL